MRIINSLAHYFEDRGRDEPINRYIRAKKALKRRIDDNALKLDIEKIETDLNNFFYPEPNNKEGIAKAEKFLDDVLQAKMGFGANQAIQTGLEDIPVLTSSGTAQHGTLAKLYNEGINSSRKSEKYFKDLIKDIDSYRIKAIKQYQKVGNSSAIYDLQNDWKNLLSVFDTAMQSFLEEYKGQSNSPYVYNKISLPNTSYHFEVFFSLVNTILNNLGYTEFNTSQLGEFFEQALAEYFDKNMDSIIENDTKVIIKESSWAGKKTVKMAGTPLSMNISFSDKDKEIAKTVLDNVVKNGNIHNINTKVEIISNNKLNEKLQQKADIVLSLENHRKIGISAKNWGSLFNEELGTEKQSGTVEAFIINGIAQTYKSMTYVEDFIHMLQDAPNASHGNPPGQYSGAEAVYYAKEMAKIGAGVSAIMGLSQGKGHNANLFIVNDRASKKIYVADIPTMIKDLFFDGNSNSKYSFKFYDDGFLDSVANDAYHLVHSYKIPKNAYNALIISKLHEKKLTFYFKKN